MDLQDSYQETAETAVGTGPTNEPPKLFVARLANRFFPQTKSGADGVVWAVASESIHLSVG